MALMRNFGLRRLLLWPVWSGVLAVACVNSQTPPSPNVGSEGGQSGGVIASVGGRAGANMPPPGTGGTVGAVSDAGSPDAAGVIECPVGMICDSFETYDVGSSPKRSDPSAIWRIESQSSPGIMAVDDTRAFSGNRALRIQIPTTVESSARGMVTTLDKRLFPATHLNARMMFFLDALPKGPGPFHWSFMQAEGAFAADGDIARKNATFGIGGWHKSTQSGFQNVMYANATEGALDCWNHTTFVVPTGRWVCVEWELDVLTHRQSVKVDNREISQMTFTEKPVAPSNGCVGKPQGLPWYVPPLSRFNLGYVHYHTSEIERNLWIDDVVLANAPIGCPAK